MVQDVEAFGKGGHEAVLDAVVHHLHEVTGTDRAAMEVAVLGRRGRAGSRARAALFRAGSRRAGGGIDARRQAGEDRIEASDRFWFASDHQAVAALATQHATT